MLRALAHSRSFRREGYRAAVALLRQAIEIGPRYARALVSLAWFYFLPWQQDRTDESRIALREIVRLAHTALHYGSEDAEVLAMAGFLTAGPGNDVDGGLTLVRSALALAPNSSLTLLVGGRPHALAGDSDVAKGYVERAARLNPYDPSVQHARAVTHFLAGGYEAVLDSTAQALRVNPRAGGSLHLRAASLGLLGRVEEARRAVEELQAVSGGLTISDARSMARFKSPGVTDALCEGLRRAGLPE